MTNTLDSLKDTHRYRSSKRRVGRGIGSGVGKTCGRGQKGAGARSGYKRRLGTEGGQVPLFRKLPTRGFSNARFRKELDTINLSEIEKVFSDGDEVSIETLRARGILTGRSHGLKVLGDGECTKKVTVRCRAISKGAQEKLEKAGVSVEILG